MATILPSRNAPITRRGRRAFTLMEMIVVVTIIALLATLIAPRIWSNVGRAKTAAAKAGITSIANSVHTYLLDVGVQEPDDNFDLEVLLAPPDAGGGSNGPYLSKESDLLDPWKHPYVIKVPGDLNRYDFDIISMGEDGELGTADDIVGPQ
jgi:general secretion pathway protein G